MDLTGIGEVAELAKTVVNKFFPDKTEEEKAKFAMALQEMNNEYQLQQGQIDINKIEAANTSIFVSGWRPFIGWVCGIALAYVSLIEPLSRFISQVIFKYIGSFPVIDTTITMQVLLGMLGLAGMRSWDKKNGTAK